MDIFTEDDCGKLQALQMMSARALDEDSGNKRSWEALHIPEDEKYTAVHYNQQFPEVKIEKEYKGSLERYMTVVVQHLSMW